MKNETDKLLVNGQPIVNNTRCEHYHSPLDIIGIKFKCCDQYYSCYYCHEKSADHPVKVWKKTEFDAKVILCGACLNELTIAAYKASNYQCPYCNASFNPKCINHDYLYFEGDQCV